MPMINKDQGVLIITLKVYRLFLALSLFYKAIVTTKLLYKHVYYGLLKIFHYLPTELNEVPNCLHL